MLTPHVAAAPAPRSEARMTADPTTLPAREAATEPAKRWRNWWWSDIEYRTPDGMLGPGMHGGTRLHPSRDVALTHADEIIAKFCPLFPELGLEHVGAFREGERPEGAP